MDFNGATDYTGILPSDYFATHQTVGFNGTTDYTGIVETNFLGWQRTNVNVHYTLKTILWSHIINFDGDIIHFDLSLCAQPDRDWGSVLRNAVVALMALVSFLFQLTLIGPYWRMYKSRGPAFLLLLNLLFCSSTNILLTQFILYLEGAIGFRIPFPFDFDYYIKQWPTRGRDIFLFIYSMSRCAALLFPFRYDRLFKKKNVYRMIVAGWIYCTLDRAEWFWANKGMNRIHCLVSGDNLNETQESYRVIMHPWMVIPEKICESLYWFVWNAPMMMDAVTLLKLFNDKYQLQSVRPWIITRPALATRVEQGRNERIRLFAAFLASTIYHFVWAIFFGGYHIISYSDVPIPLASPKQLFVRISNSNYSYILENVLPYLLMLWFSRDVRTQWEMGLPCLFKRRTAVRPIIGLMVGANDGLNQRIDGLVAFFNDGVKYYAHAVASVWQQFAKHAIVVQFAYRWLVICRAKILSAKCYTLLLVLPFMVSLLKIAVLFHVRTLHCASSVHNFHSAKNKNRSHVESKFVDFGHNECENIYLEPPLVPPSHSQHFH